MENHKLSNFGYSYIIQDMTIVLKNKETLYFNEFKFKCCAGKNGFTKNKTEGDKKTPKGTYSLGNLYYRRNRNTKPFTKLRTFSVSCIDNPIVGSSNTIKSELKYNDLPKATPCFSPPESPIT